jgi:hypothetical protein
MNNEQNRQELNQFFVWGKASAAFGKPSFPYPPSFKLVISLSSRKIPKTILTGIIDPLLENSKNNSKNNSYRVIRPSVGKLKKTSLTGLLDPL